MDGLVGAREADGIHQLLDVAVDGALRCGRVEGVQLAQPVAKESREGMARDYTDGFGYVDCFWGRIHRGSARARCR